MCRVGCGSGMVNGRTANGGNASGSSINVAATAAAMLWAATAVHSNAAANADAAYGAMLKVHAASAMHAGAGQGCDGCVRV